MSRATLTIYRMALHFEVAILFAGRKNGEKGEDGKEERQCGKGFFCVEEWDDRGSETYRFKIPRYCYVVSEVIYLMVDSLP